jgi:hypothetical protein
MTMHSHSFGGAPIGGDALVQRGVSLRRRPAAQQQLDISILNNIKLIQYHCRLELVIM